jgi:hypothetical protein
VPAPPTVQTPRGPFTLARDCDGCTLCCKVLSAGEPLNKPMGVWCGHCVPGTGCGIHASRPPVCRDFHCVWLMDASLGAEWQPERCHMVLSLDLDGRRLNATTDQDYPDAWRREPYYSQLKAWASVALPRNGQVVAYLNRDVFVILPDRHVELGVLGPDDYIFIERLDGGGWGARKVDESEARMLRQTGRAGSEA